MLGRELLHLVDHTVLKAITSWADIEKLCEEALTYDTASVCIPPSYVKRVSEVFPDLTICTVIGFPLGNQTTFTKIMETKQAILDGAGEIDMVINVGDVKNNDFPNVLDEIRQIKAVCEDRILKVIIETCYLTEGEIIEMSKIVSDSGADYIKTSTGFGTAGATLENVYLMKANSDSHLKIKAAGGIRTIEDMVAYAEAGCDRIGASIAVDLLKDKLDVEL